MPTLSEFQAQRSIAAKEFADKPYQQPAHLFLASLHPDDEQLHRQHVLPGAKRAVTHAELGEWRNEGLSEAQMVERVNVRFDGVNYRRLAEFDVWRNGPLQEQIAEHQERQAARARALAEFERQLVN